MRTVYALGLVVVASACSSAEDARDGAELRGAVAEAPADTPSAPIDRGWRAGAVQVEAPIVLASFEAASAACNEWVEAGADAIRSVPARSGDYACRLCATPGSSEISIARDVGPLAPGHYTMTAWVRSRPNAPAPSSVSATLASARAVGAPSDAYAPIEVAIDVATTSTLRARIAAPASQDECLLVDDVTIRRD